MRKETLARTSIFLIAVIVALSLISLTALAASGPSPSPRKENLAEKSRPGHVTEAEKAQFKCSAHDSMQERIRCRLQLDEENEYGYLPEECRAQAEDARAECVASYKKSQQCWRFEKDPDRFRCVKTASELSGTVAENRQACANRTGQDRAACILQLQRKVDVVVKFRIYNLEEKAQRLMARGLASVDDVTVFVSAMEQQKQNYNNAATIAEKKAVLQTIRGMWQEFVAKAKNKAKTA